MPFYIYIYYSDFGTVQIKQPLIDTYFKIKKISQEAEKRWYKL